MVLLLIFGVLIQFVIPFVILVALYRFLMRHRHVVAGKEGKPLTERESVLGVLALTSAVTLLPALFLLPTYILGLEEEGAIFASRIVLGVLVLLAGIPLGALLTGKLLMVLGLLMLTGSLPYVFNNFGDAGAFAVIIVAFAAVIGTVVYLHRKDERNED